MLFSAVDLSKKNSTYNINIRAVSTLKKGDDPLSFIFIFDEDSTEHHIRFFEKDMKPGMIEFPCSYKDHIGNNMIHIMFYASAHHTTGVTTDSFGASPIQGLYEKASFSFFYIERGNDLKDPYIQKLFDAVYDKAQKPKDILDYIQLKLITTI